MKHKLSGLRRILKSYPKLLAESPPSADQHYNIRLFFNRFKYFKHIAGYKLTIVQLIEFCIRLSGSSRFFYQFYTKNLFCFERQNLAYGSCTAIKIKYRLSTEIIYESEGLAVKSFCRFNICLKKGKSAYLKFQSQQFFHIIVPAPEYLHRIANNRICKIII